MEDYRWTLSFSDLFSPDALPIEITISLDYLSCHSVCAVICVTSLTYNNFQGWVLLSAGLITHIETNSTRLQYSLLAHEHWALRTPHELLKSSLNLPAPVPHAAISSVVASSQSEPAPSQSELQLLHPELLRLTDPYCLGYKMNAMKESEEEELEYELEELKDKHFYSSNELKNRINSDKNCTVSEAQTKIEIFNNERITLLTTIEVLEADLGCLRAEIEKLESDTNLLREVLRQRQPVLLCSEVAPASGFILVNFPAANQDTLGEAVHDHLRNIEAG
ncbi:hypothetical protein J6590_048702 [Homalodisca vitripennis]|nr:hypothetical protein J6590_048702 [Homalodisca vitripennis]